MLPKNFRFAVLNATGVNQVYASGGRIAIKGRFWRHGADGRIVYGALRTFYELATGETLNNAAYARSSNLVNADLVDGRPAEGVEIFLLTTTHGSPNGAITAYLQGSWDGGTTWVADANGTSICAVTHSGAGELNGFGRVL